MQAALPESMTYLCWTSFKSKHHCRSRYRKLTNATQQDLYDRHTSLMNFLITSKIIRKSGTCVDKEQFHQKAERTNGGTVLNNEGTSLFYDSILVTAAAIFNCLNV